jgi:hypothetical protein
MTKAEVERSRAALTLRVADLERVTHHRDAITVERECGDRGARRRSG